MSRNGQPAVLVGTFAMPPGTAFDRHSHHEHQLAWASSGVLTVVTDMGTWVLPPSRALWIPAETPHVTAGHGRTTMRSLYLVPRHCPIDWTEPRPVAITTLLAELIHHLSDRDLDESHRARVEAVLFDMLAPVAVTTIEAPLPLDPRAREVAERLVADPADDTGLEGWGRRVGASGRTLARAFQHDTGLPFGRWRTLVRMRAALPLMAAGESVTRVAKRVGYETPSAFVAAFRRETGISPGRYFE
jgi:AraC-like DNA-binding protein/quercetin dioxygenase-like cupin family protein